MCVFWTTSVLHTADAVYRAGMLCPSLLSFGVAEALLGVCVCIRVLCYICIYIYICLNVLIVNLL